MLRDHRSHATGATQPRGHDGQVKQREQEDLHPRDRVGQTSGATQRCLILESARALGIRDAQAVGGLQRLLRALPVDLLNWSDAATRTRGRHP